jgi:hypothetical protein
MLLGLFSRGKTHKIPGVSYKAVSNRHFNTRFGKIGLEARLLCDGFPGFRKHVKVVCERTHHS